MLRVLKLFVSSVLVVCLLFTQCFMALAAEDIENNSDKNTIIIVPGLLGSELFSSKDQTVDSTFFKKGHRFWVPECVMPFIDQDAQINLEKLSEAQLSSIIRDLSFVVCDEDGNSKVAVMKTNPILDCRNNPDTRNFGTANFYNKFVEELIKNTDEENYDIVFFSYDWRLSCGKIAQELEKFINKNEYQHVTLISHSMGGLVCASYLSNPQNKQVVDKVISLGSPFLGSTRAFSAIDYGKFIDGFLGFLSAPILSPFIKSVAECCPAVYELLPPKQYFDYSNSGYLNRPNFNICIEPKNVKTYDATVKYILKNRSWPKCASKLLKNAQKFHDTLYKDGKFVLDDENIKLYNVIGADTKTIDKVNLTKMSCVWPKEIYINGDGLVTIKSALVGNNLESKENYYVNNISHMDLALNKDSIKLVIDLIKGNTEEYSKGDSIVKRIRPRNYI